ncbi:MAG TPA: ABC transporter permease [Candidatus Saccharimonadales bacterium]|nr:ABC transporter permease [Candidatus Saccharimonadales bacterium]
MHTLWQDVRYGLRVLSKNPGFTLVVVLTLALGIGATTSIFSVVYATLLHPLPYPGPERIVRVWEVDAKGKRQNFSDPNFEDLREANRSFAALAQYGTGTTTVTGGSHALRVGAADVSRQFFEALGVQPAVGRGFAGEETRMGGNPVVLVSFSFWKSALGGAQDFSLRHLNFDGKSYSIIGVMPQGFRFPDATDLWIPREQFERYPSRTALNWQVLGRLKDGVSLPQARADASQIAKNVKQKLGDETWMSDAAMLPLQEALTGNIRTSLLLLLGAAGILLLAACANTTNLLLVRSATRQREFAVRVALGASRGRLLSQFFAEALLLSLGGAALGIVLAYWGVNAILQLAPEQLPAMADVQINGWVLAFSLAVSFVTACGLSFMVAVRAVRRNLSEDLKEGEQRQSGGVKEVRVRAVMMTAQVAVATVLLAGAALLGQSLIRLMHVQPGYRTENILTAAVFPPDTEEAKEKTRRAQMIDQILQRMKAIPGVDATGIVGDLPLASGPSNGTFLLVENQNEMKTFADFERIARIPERTGSAFYQVASADYFLTLQIPLVRGRLFDERDGADTPHVAVISAALAQERWPKLDPLGRHIEFGNMDGDVRLLEIVGVVGDVHSSGLGDAVEPMVYVNSRQRVPRHFTFVAHTTASPLSVIPAVRNLLLEMDPNLAPRFATFPDIVSNSLSDRQFQLCLLAVFAAGALALAMLGIYGVTSYLVSERTREIGIRMALGAQPGNVLGLILRQGGIVVLVGIVLGICGQLALTGVLRGMLYGITAADPFTLAGASALLAGLALFACWLPARRATRIDPVVALRSE